eukprot:2596893-Rhodomonas_salina.1
MKQPDAVCSQAPIRSPAAIPFLVIHPVIGIILRQRTRPRTCISTMSVLALTALTGTAVSHRTTLPDSTSSFLPSRTPTGLRYRLHSITRARLVVLC